VEESNSSPSENLAAPPVQVDPSPLTPNRREFDAEYPPWYSLPPSTANFQYADKSKLPWFKPRRGFEKPSFSRIVILTILCLIAYPAFHILTLVAGDKSLFTVRLLVSVWSSGVGFALGYILLKIGARHLEATSEFTLVGHRDSLRLHFKQPGPL